jgi:pimeloyl-ACP methyl ester carboxylesterase
MLQVHANGLEFHFLTQGSGPKVLLLHGFPDTAHTWRHQMDALAQAGFCAMAPYLRGYHREQPAAVNQLILDWLR